MQRIMLTIAGSLCTAALVAGALSGCAAKVAGGPSAAKTQNGSVSIAHPSATATVKPKTPTPTPTPTGFPALPADAMWRIRATVTGGNGAIADVVETVYKPVAWTPADNTLVTNQCPASGWPSNYPTPIGMHSTVTATLRAGSKPWTEYSPVGLGFILGNLSAWTGTFYDMSPVNCGAGTPLTIPGSATGVAPLSPASDPSGVSGGEGWYNGFYGFAATYDGNDSMPAGLVTLSNCSLQLSAYAIAANPAVASWATEAQPQQGGGTCWYGPAN
jgi:hypothetical protein